MKKKTIILAGLLGILGTALAESPDPKIQKQHSSELERVRHEIHGVRQSIHTSKAQRERYQILLKQSEIEISQLTIRLLKIHEDLQKQQTILDELQQKQIKQNQQLDERRVRLADQLRYAQKLGKQPYLKLLLDQNDPTELHRVLMYLNYYTHEQIKLIQDLNITLRELEENQQRIQHRAQTLQILHDEQDAKKQLLESSLEQRRSVVAQLNQNILSQEQRLNELTENEKNLQKLIVSLEKKREHITPPRLDQPFSKRKGALTMPTAGKITEHFGEAIAQQTLKRNGIFITAPMEQAIHAVHEGTVVFADWLRGFGLLLIIDHGDGYMSLYGRTYSLYKQTGDLVRTGELIANVGQSGGYSEPGLYFEIRHKGTAINPAPWFG